MNRNIKILQLYPKDMNIYGDLGNVQVLKRRIEWFGFGPEIIDYNVGDIFPNEIDIIIAGGGQDSGQGRIVDDLQIIAKQLNELADDNMPMLAICGMYQLFGHYFETRDGKKLPGIGIFDAQTIGGEKRYIGNVIAESEEFGKLLGFENHSGETFLNAGAQPLSESILLGVGNNPTAKTEGIIKNNVIGTYLHGPILPKNPKVADFLITKALERRFGKKITLNSNTIDKVDEKITNKARYIASHLKR